MSEGLRIKEGRKKRRIRGGRIILVLGQPASSVEDSALELRIWLSIELLQARMRQGSSNWRQIRI